ncbi:branched-chain amino acid ABC transporter permease [Pelagibius sp. Alg239-R121]|uniref:branched-chain amino acid ABC transporter permease n=1 Tax=Pelagibius sp. Alg239-R121 TaxID=2993448 RepID=UPI0024A74D7D|nr:branched-chain amino acid ABC transporter permease [Pelagibius sp. Alg239-R121]
MISLDTILIVTSGGLVLGAIYALMASGLAVVWTTLGIFNFAHGAFIAAGAYIGWQIAHADASGLGLVAGTLGTLLAMFVFGVLFHIALVRPFERRANIVAASVITTLAGATVIENVINLIWGPRSKQIGRMLDGDFSLGPIALSMNDLALVVIVVATLGLVGWFLGATRTGRSMRAVAQNREAAELMGLDVPRLYAAAFGLSAAMAGLAGIFIGSIRFMTPTMGADPLMKALIVVIFGGVARFTSPIYAALIIGMVEAFSTYFVGLYWTPAVLFALMMVVLVLKPAGLFGKHQRTL